MPTAMPPPHTQLTPPPHTHSIREQNSATSTLLVGSTSGGPVTICCSASRPSAPVEAAMQLHPSTLLSHPLHHQIRAQTNPHGRHAHVHGTAAVSAVLWIVAAPRSSTGVGAVVGSVYVGVVWDSRPGMVLCKQHGRTPRFSKRMGTKHAPLANSSSDHFVCRSSSYSTCRWVGQRKVKVG